MKPTARVVHHIPGRARLNIQARRGDSAFFDKVADALSAEAGVNSAHVNPGTGSVLVEYSTRLDEVLRAADDLFDLLPAPAFPENAKAVGQMMPPAMLIAGVFFGAVGVVQTVRGDILMPALTAYWYAWNALRMGSSAAAARPDRSAQAT